MTTIMTRSAVRFWTGSAPPDLAYIVDGRVVTWREVMESRRERQCRRLVAKRASAPMRAYRVWAGYFDQPLMGGWHAFINDWRGRDFQIWIDRDCDPLKRLLMGVFPLLLPFGAVEDQWRAWKPEFAGRFCRRKQDGRPMGVSFVWWDGRNNLRAQSLPNGFARA